MTTSPRHCDICEQQVSRYARFDFVQHVGHEHCYRTEIVCEDCFSMWFSYFVEVIELSNRYEPVPHHLHIGIFAACGKEVNS